MQAFAQWGPYLQRLMGPLSVNNCVLKLDPSLFYNKQQQNKTKPRTRCHLATYSAHVTLNECCEQFVVR